MQTIWLVMNAFLKQQSFKKTADIFQSAAKEMGIDLVEMPNDRFLSPDSLYNHPDKALFFDKDLRLARRMEGRGMRLFNPGRAIEICDDKTLTTLVIAEKDLPQPKTILAPMTYPNIGYTNLDFLRQVAEALPFPLVVKEGKGSFGQQVYLAHNFEELVDIVKRVQTSDLLFQRFIAESAGEDLRLYVVGDEVAASMRRVNTRGDFRANIENGGTAFTYTPTKEEASLAVAAAKACGTDFAGVDILQSKDGPLVCEVNSNAHFLGLMELTGINPAKHILNLIRETR